MIDEMLANRIISKSNIPWALPIVIVKKRDGTSRSCIDYRKLNKMIIRQLSNPSIIIEVVFVGVQNCRVYIDDILIYSSTFKEHLEHLEQVFKRLYQANLKIKTKKCEFGKNEVEFLCFKIKQGFKAKKTKPLL